jgi:hypothetical protein
VPRAQFIRETKFANLKTLTGGGEGAKEKSGIFQSRLSWTTVKI